MITQREMAQQYAENVRARIRTLAQEHASLVQHLAECEAALAPELALIEKKEPASG